MEIKKIICIVFVLTASCHAIVDTQKHAPFQGSSFFAAGLSFGEPEVQVGQTTPGATSGPTPKSNTPATMATTPGEVLWQGGFGEWFTESYGQQRGGQNFEGGLGAI